MKRSLDKNQGLAWLAFVPEVALPPWRAIVESQYHPGHPLPCGVAHSIVQDDVALVDQPQLVGMSQTFEEERLVARDAGDNASLSLLPVGIFRSTLLLSFCAPSI